MRARGRVRMLLVMRLEGLVPFRYLLPLYLFVLSSRLCPFFTLFLSGFLMSFYVSLYFPFLLSSLSPHCFCLFHFLDSTPLVFTPFIPISVRCSHHFLLFLPSSPSLFPFFSVPVTLLPCFSLRSSLSRRVLCANKLNTFHGWPRPINASPAPRFAASACTRKNLFDRAREQPASPASSLLLLLLDAGASRSEWATRVATPGWQSSNASQFISVRKSLLSIFFSSDFQGRRCSRFNTLTAKRTLTEAPMQSKQCS